MKALLRAGVAFLVTLPLLFSQTTSPLTVTPTLVSVQLGQPLYCAARWTKTAGTVQVYCYTSSLGHTWDQLIYNSIFPVTGTTTLPYIVLCPEAVAGTLPPVCDFAHSILWQFNLDKTTAGVVDWAVSWAGTGTGQGTFQ